MYVRVGARARARTTQGLGEKTFLVQSGKIILKSRHIMFIQYAKASVFININCERHEIKGGK